jgi:thiopeptide-type bacteriocin biosynthesis protein
MKTYTFHPGVILRTPSLSVLPNITDDIQFLLTSPFFRNAIYLASPAFYSALEAINFQADKLQPHHKKTLAGYINRMRYRPTPFGLFSSVTKINWQPDAGMDIILTKTPILHLWPSINQKENEPDDSARVYLKNPTLWRAGNEYRFYKPETAFKGTDRYSVHTIPYQKILAKISAFCSTERGMDEIIKFTSDLSGADNKTASSFVEEMIDSGILLSCEGISPVQPRYTKGYETQGLNLNSAKKILNPNATLPSPDDIHSTGSHYYAIAERQLISGGLPTRHQQKILEGIELLQHLQQPKAIDSLDNFKNSFKDKFQDQFIPLMQALDPDLGIGYADMERGYDAPLLLKDIRSGKKEDNPPVILTDLTTFLIGKISGLKDHDNEIVLTDKDLGALTLKPLQAHLPSSISVIFRFIGERVFLESVGGASATSISGRFSILNDDFDRICVDIAANDVSSNPNVVFAEIHGAPERGVADIERRHAFYPYEIPLFVKPSLPREGQIHLSDLWVGVSNNNIVLWSSRLRKRVICRLSSAYNYHRCMLSVYRFLCDLQHQEITSNLNLNLKQLIPGLSFYPRISYKNSVLSLASWRLSREDIQYLTSFANQDDFTSKFKILAVKRNWPAYIAIRNNDQQLVYNSNNKSDIADLMVRIKGKEEVVITEYPFRLNCTKVRDESLNQYGGQFVSHLLRSEEIFRAPPNVPENMASLYKAKRNDQRWLYFKLYCHPVHADNIISRYLSKWALSAEAIDENFKWFFIRYNDGAHHLRVRIFVHDNAAFHKNWERYYFGLENLRAKGFLTNLQMDSYQRELERYRERNIELVERVFWADSNWSAQRIGKIKHQNLDAVLLLLVSMTEIMNAFTISQLGQAEFCRALFVSFQSEFRSENISMANIFQRYREDLDQSFTRLQKQLRKDKYYKIFLAYITALSDQLKPQRRRSMCADIIHMHLNRNLVEEPRKQEMVCYYLLWKYLTYKLKTSTDS